MFLRDLLFPRISEYPKHAENGQTGHRPPPAACKVLNIHMGFLFWKTMGVLTETLFRFLCCIFFDYIDFPPEPRMGFL